MTTATFSAKRINLFIILISSLLMAVVLNLPFKAKQFGDEASFHEQSKHLAQYIKGECGYDKVTITKAPGPIAFYAPVYLLAPAHATDDQLWVYAIAATFIISTVSLLLIFRIGSNLFSKEVGLLTVMLFFIFPIHAYYSLGILAEIPAFFGLSLGLYGWSVVYLNPNSKKGWITLFLGLWYLIMCRPNVMLLLGLGFIIVIYAYFRNKEFFRIYGKKLILTFCMIGIASLGVAKLAKVVTGTKSGENQEGLFYFVAFMGRFQFREEPTDFRFWDNDIRPDSKDYQNWGKVGGELSNKMIATHRESNDVYREFLINDALEHPFLFTRQFFIKCFYGHLYFINSVKPADFHLGPFRGVAVYWFVIFLINFVNLMLIFGTFLFLLKQKHLINYWPLWGVIISLLIFHGLTYMEPRYMFPSRVALYIMSAAGLYRIKWIRQKVNFMAKFAFPASNKAEV